MAPVRRRVPAARVALADDLSAQRHAAAARSRSPAGSAAALAVGAVASRPPRPPPRLPPVRGVRHDRQHDPTVAVAAAATVPPAALSGTCAIRASPRCQPCGGRGKPLTWNARATPRLPAVCGSVRS